MDMVDGVGICLDSEGQNMTFISTDEFFASVPQGLKCVLIPASCKSLPDSCFSGCKDLTRVTFARGSTLVTIGKKAFTGCTSLKDIEIPATVEEIGDGCFEASWREIVPLSRVTFASGSILKRIGEKAFRGCAKIEEIEIPASVTELGKCCFERCSSLSSVTFASGSSLKHIGENAFSRCSSLHEITIPAGVEVIHRECFSHNGNLQHVGFESGSCLKRIDQQAFA